MDMEAAIKDLQARVSKLEANNPKQKKITPSDNDTFKGATGGVRLLIQEGFFGNKKSLPGIRTEMESRGYHYSRQAVQIALSRLSKKGGQLVCLDEKGANYYAARK